MTVSAVWQLIRKFIREMPGAQSSRNKREEEEQSRRTHTYWFYFCAATVIKMVLHRLWAQWSRFQSPDMDLHVYGQLIFFKGIIAVQWGK